MSKSSPYSSIHEASQNLAFWKQSKGSAVLILGGVAAKVDKAVRESDSALLSGEAHELRSSCAFADANFPFHAHLDHDSHWTWMIAELAESGDTLPKSLSCVSEEVSAVLGKSVSIVSDQKFAKLAKEAERLAASAEKEAKRAEKRRQNKLAKAELPSAPEVFKKHPIVLSLEKRLARIAKSMDVYRYLDPTVAEDMPRPSVEDVADFLSAIEKAIYEIALEYGRKGVNMLGKLSELLELVTKAFPETKDVGAPIPASSVKTAVKPIRQAENRV